MGSSTTIHHRVNQDLWSRRHVLEAPCRYAPMRRPLSRHAERIPRLTGRKFWSPWCGLHIVLWRFWRCNGHLHIAWLLSAPVVNAFDRGTHSTPCWLVRLPLGVSLYVFMGSTCGFMGLMDIVWWFELCDPVIVPLRTLGVVFLVFSIRSISWVCLCCLRRMPVEVSEQAAYLGARTFLHSMAPYPPPWYGTLIFDIWYWYLIFWIKFVIHTWKSWFIWCVFLGPWLFQNSANFMKFGHSVELKHACASY